MRLRDRFAVAAVAVLLAATSMTAPALSAGLPQDPDTDALIQRLLDPKVEENLRAVTAALPGTTVVQTLRGKLAQGAVQKININAQAGLWHMAAVCDDACSDVDVRMLAPDGQVAYADQGPDKFPSTRVEVQGEISFVMEIVMKKCAAADCVWGARIYRKDP